MAVAVEVPKLGNTVEECLIAKWRKHKGEAVSAGEVVAEIETDKATFEVAAPVGGHGAGDFFARRDAGAGVHQSICDWRAGRGRRSVSSGIGGRSAVPEDRGCMRPTAPAPAVPEQNGGGPGSSGPGSGRGIEPARPPVRRGARLETGWPCRRDRVRAAGCWRKICAGSIIFRPRVSAVARQRLREGAEVQGPGSGVAGMILSSDVGAPAARISSLREKIARRMRESLAATAQYTLHASADAGGLLVLRAQVKASKGLPDININDLVTWCTVQALVQVPELNAEFIDGRIHPHQAVHIGFACDTPRGLMVPVVKDADRLTAGELSTRMKELTAQAVGGTLGSGRHDGRDVHGEQPGRAGNRKLHAAAEPAAGGDSRSGCDSVEGGTARGRIEFIDSIGLSITLDHQVIDGAPGARFLKVVKEKIENVESLCTIWAARDSIGVRLECPSRSS